MEATNFNSNVFVNCPFDSEYDPLLKALLFTIISLGFTPRLSSERVDSGEQRINKICGLIRESRYSIHDLSRLKSSEAGEFYRMNMPFELGVDYGAREYHRGELAQKKFLILEKERYDFMKAISDLSGVDIKAHGHDPKILVRRVRNWFRSTTGSEDIEGPTGIWYDYTDFNADLYDKLKEQGFSDDDIDDLPVTEFLDYAQGWVDADTP